MKTANLASSSLEKRPPLTIRSQILPFALPDIGEQEVDAVSAILRSGWLTSGPAVKRFEQEFATQLGVKEAIAVHSCTAALHLTAVAWQLSSQDAVLLPAITFTATAEVFGYMNCLPLILDVDRNSHLLSATMVRDFIKKECSWSQKSNALIHRASQRHIRALVAVHLGGRPCDIDSLREIALEYHLKFLDDAAHAFPSYYKKQAIGSLTDATAFSFYATKNLSTGEGGMLATNDRNLANKARQMRLHGIEGQSYGRRRWHYDVVCNGYKYNMTDMCAALGIVQLQRSEAMLQKRRWIHNYYTQELSSFKNKIRLNPDCKYSSSYHLYIIEVKPELGINRDQFVDAMYERNIAVSLHFIPLYRLSYYQKKYQFKAEDYPNSEVIYKNMFSLPIYSAMKEQDTKDVVAAIKDICR